MYFETECARSRSSKVIEFGTNRKRVCDFLLVINSNLGRILPSFRDIAGSLQRTATPPLFHPNFGVVPIGLDCRYWGSEERSPKLILRVSTSELTTYMATVPQRYRRTDGRTEGRATVAIGLRAYGGGQSEQCDVIY